MIGSNYESIEDSPVKEKRNSKEIFFLIFFLYKYLIFRHVGFFNDYEQTCISKDNRK